MDKVIKLAKISNNTQEKSYLCTACESRLHSLRNAQTSLASHSFALPLHIEKEVNFWMGKPRVSEQADACICMQRARVGS